MWFTCIDCALIKADVQYIFKFNIENNSQNSVFLYYIFFTMYIIINNIPFLLLRAYLSCHLSKCRTHPKHVDSPSQESQYTVFSFQKYQREQTFLSSPILVCFPGILRIFSSLSPSSILEALKALKLKPYLKKIRLYLYSKPLH